MDNTVRDKLKQLLDNTNIRHKTEILKCDTLKSAHIYCKINTLSGQETGPLIESYILSKYNLHKNSSSDCIGDAMCNNSTNLEIKVSTGGKEKNKFNYVQLRMNHNCEYLLTAYYIDYTNIDTLGELFVFRVSKPQMQDLILKYGSYAHGTIQKLGKITKEDLANPLNDKEYVIRPKYGDHCWNNLLLYRIDECHINTD